MLQAAIYLLPLGVLQQAIAGFEAGLLGLESNGSMIYTTAGIFVISNNCTGLVSASVLAAVIFALKKPEIKKKAAMFLAGAIALLLLNFVRVYIVLMTAMQWGAQAADLAHTVSWFSTAGLVLVLWYAAVKKVAGIKDISGLM